MNLNCVICADLIKHTDDVHITPCGHMFHFTCLLQWLERSKSCPQCRNKCSQANIHKVYFNVANLDTSRIDIGSLQEQLDNAVLQVKEKEKEVKKAQDEIGVLKAVRKKSMKTISGLESKVGEKDFIISSYIEQFKLLKINKSELDEQRKQIEELKAKNNLMTSVQEVLTATSTEVENMLKEESNIKTLNIWVASLKRELRICENKKNDLRQALKSAQNEFRNERKTNGSLQEKIVQLESENYRMTDVIKSYESRKNSDFVKNEGRSSSQAVNSVDRQLNLLKTVHSSSPNILERIKIIEESNSPYLNIKSSSIGLTHLLKQKESIREKITNKAYNRHNGILKQTTSDLSEKYSIFKKPRLEMGSTVSTNGPNLSFNGVGGSEKAEDFPDFPRKPSSDKSKSSLSQRVKCGKLKRLHNPATSDQDLDKLVMK